MPERERYSYRLRLDLPTPANESLPELDTFYTLNVLLGFSRLKPAQRPPALASIYASCCREAGTHRWRTYAYGMALWTGVALGLEPPPNLVNAFNSILNNPQKFSA